MKLCKQRSATIYKSASPICLRVKPLDWWNKRKHLLPNLAKLAQKYLGIVAISVPSERLFSTAGNIVSAKRAALLPDNVDKLVLLHENLLIYYFQNTLPFVISLQCPSC